MKADIAVRGNQLTATGNNMPYGITQCYLLSAILAKLVLNLATPEGCKAELT